MATEKELWKERWKSHAQVLQPSSASTGDKTNLLSSCQDSAIPGKQPEPQWVISKSSATGRAGKPALGTSLIWQGAQPHSPSDPLHPTRPCCSDSHSSCHTCSAPLSLAALGRAPLPHCLVATGRHPPMATLDPELGTLLAPPSWPPAGRAQAGGGC